MRIVNQVLFALGNLSTNNEKQTLAILNYCPVILETMKGLLELLPRLPDDVMKQVAWICKNICKVSITEQVVSNLVHSLFGIVGVHCRRDLPLVQLGFPHCAGQG
jgi:hypothetical protein